MRYLSLTCLAAIALLWADDAGGQARIRDFSGADTTGSPGGSSHQTHLAAPPTVVAYVPIAGDLISLERVSSGWLEQPIDVLDDVGRWPSLKRDPMGQPHVAYYDATHARLKYARRPTTAWMTEVVDPGPGVGQYGALAVSSTAVFVSYYDAVNGNLRVAARPLAGGPWTIETADAGGDVGRHTSIVESGGVVAVTYYDATNGDLKFARRLGGPSGGWVVETVDAPGNVGLFTSLVQIGGDYAVSYYDMGYGALKVATRIAGMWSIETVDDAGNVGEYSSVVAGGSGVGDQLAVSYYDRTNADLKLARKVGTWLIEVLDANGDVGRSCSLASNGSMASDSVSVAYHDVTQPGLLFLTRKNPVVGVGRSVSGAGDRLWCSPGIGGAARIHFRVATAGPVSIVVRDVAGRRVGSPVRRFVEPGEHVAAWGGVDDGAPASGVYFVELRTRTARVQARTVLLR